MRFGCYAYFVPSKEMNAKTRPVHSVNVSMHLQMTFIAFIESTSPRSPAIYTRAKYPSGLLEIVGKAETIADVVQHAAVRINHLAVFFHGIIDHLEVGIVSRFLFVDLNCGFLNGGKILICLLYTSPSPRD